MEPVRPTSGSLKIVFMGSPEIAVPSLKALLEGGDSVVGVVSQRDRPAGRGKKVQPCAIAALARERGLPLLQPERLDDSFLKDLRELEPGLIVVCAYGKILPREILDLPPHRCLNVHFSLLPKYRGAAPVQWALINGETETGVTTLFMTETLDAGPVLLQKKVPVKPGDDAGTLGRRLANVGAELLIETVALLKRNDLHPIPQNGRDATPARSLKKGDGRIDFEKKATAIVNQIRGMTPWPGAFALLDGKVLKVHRAEISPKKAKGQPGEVTAAGPSGIEVATGQEALLLTEVQLEGSKRMPAGEFLKGHAVKPGKILDCQARRAVE